VTDTSSESDSESKTISAPAMLPFTDITDIDAKLLQQQRNDEDKQLNEWWSIVKKSQSDINAWLPGCPANFTHMSLLIKAEIARWTKKPSTAIRLYGRAIDEAKKYEFNYHEALAAELCAEFFHSRNDMNLTAFWLRRSVHSYRYGLLSLLFAQ
jgi:hypothetical protein